MEFLNRAINQLGDLFKTLPPAARIMTGLLAVLVVAALAFLFQHQTTGGNSYLMGGQGVSANEIPAMEAAFGQANLRDYSIEGNRIRVPKGRESEFMAALADAGALPAYYGSYLEKAVNSSGPFTNAKQQEEMIKSAKQQELAKIVRNMTGIEDASVIFDTQQRPGFRQDFVGTALVSVKRMGNRPMEEEQVSAIQRAVAGGIRGLSPKDVTVLDLVSGLSFGGSEANNSATDDPYLARMRKYREEFVSQIRQALSHISGVTVAATVDLDKEVSQVQESVKVDPKAVPISVRDETGTNSSDQASPGGRPGLEAQQGTNTAASLANASRGAHSEEDKSFHEEQSVVSHDRMTTEKVGLTPQAVRVSVGVPANYFEEAWRAANPVAPGETPKVPDKQTLEQFETLETNKIRNTVLQLLPAGPTTNAADLVSVNKITISPQAEIPAPSFLPVVMRWLQDNWGTVGALVLALMSLMFLKSFAKSTSSGSRDVPADGVISAQVAATGEGPQLGEEAAAGTNAGRKRKFESAPSLRDELVEMIREDPNAAANILRGWIGTPN